MRLATATLLALLLTATTAASAPQSECVVLLHGLARTAASMNKLQAALEQAGYRVANVDYPSRKHTIEYLAPLAVNKGLSTCRSINPGGTIHFVTHSLGGILLRQYLVLNQISELGRVVMLAPPNQGTEAADDLRRLPGFEWLNGPAGNQLGKGEDSVPSRLGPANFELGVIAGSRTIDPLTSAFLPDPDDGRVSVADTRLQGMSDFVVVEHSHAFIMRMRRPIALTLRFLATGSFDGEVD